MARAPAARELDDLAGLLGEAEAAGGSGAGAAPSVGSLGRIGESAAAAAARADGGAARGETSLANFLCHSAHPAAATAHLAFKGAALALYIAGGLASAASLGYVQASRGAAAAAA